MKEKKRGRKKAILIIAVVCAAAGLCIWGISSVVSGLRRMSPEGFQSIEVSGGTIESTVTGTGSLAYQDARSVSVPAGLEITSVLHDQGSAVAAGEIIASVDRLGCERLMTSTYDQIAELDAKLRETSSEPELVEIKAPVAGHVVTESVAAGSDVLGVLAEHGSLLTISPDSRMGAKIRNVEDQTAEPGQTVILRLPDGTTRSAAVETVEENGFTAALSDPGVVVGTEVTAETTQGQTLGTGTVECLDGVSVAAPAGTVEKVSVSNGAAVKAGQVLFSVRASGRPAAYLDLEQQHKSLTKTYDQLAQIYRSGGITAPVSGTIVSMNLKAGQNTSALDASGGIVSAAGDAAAGGFSSSAAQDALNMFGAGMRSNASEVPGCDFLLLSAEAGEDAGDEGDVPDAPEQSEEPQEPQEPTVAPPEETAEPSGALPSETAPAQPEETASAQIPDRSIPRIEVPLVPPIPGLPLQTQIQMLPICTGSVIWDPADVQAQFATEYTAKVSLTALEGFYFPDDCQAFVFTAEPEDVTVSGDTLTFTVTYPKTQDRFELSDIDWEAIRDFLGAEGTLDLAGLQDLIMSGLLPSSSLNFDPGSLTSQIDPSSLYGAVDPSALYGGIDASGIDPSSLYGSMQGGALPSYDISGAVADGGYGAMYSQEPVACSIAPDDSMDLVIQINQMDILAVKPGMHCMVTVDALSDREFEGTVTKVSEMASGTGDYTASITLPRDADMRAGMTASAIIVTSETSDVLTLPASAIQEDGNRVFVYTQIDSDTGTLGGETEVETGVSNGTEVEILSGLKEGQTVYYEQEDPLQRMMRMMGGAGAEESRTPDATHVPPQEAIQAP